jgi:glycosyltransferase involved in cell wall biosynthesis
MRIGIDIRKLNDYGIGTHIRNVVLRAAELAPQHHFVLYHDPTNIVEYDARNFTLQPEAAGKYSLREHISLGRRVGKNRIDFFHSPHYTFPLFANCRGIVTIHDLIHFKYEEHFPSWKVQAAKFVMRQAARKATTIVTVSETTKRDLLDWMPDVETKVKVVYNRISDEWFDPAPEIHLEAVGIPKDFLLYVGNFKKHKGIGTLIEAYRRAQDFPALVLVGQGTHVDHELSEKIFSTPGVRLLGFASSSLLRKMYSNAQVFVFPSFYEGFGYPPLEAMAGGSPVVSSDAPAMKEVLGDAAEFFERGNADHLLTKLKSILSDSERRKSLIQLGKQQAKKFATDESPHRLIEEWK